jgi:hypothetical protein
VSYYALFQGWLLLSQPPGCLRTPTTFATEQQVGDLSRRSGLLPSRRRRLAPATSLARHRPVGIRGLVGVGNPHRAPSPSSALPPTAVATDGCTSIHFGENQLSPGSIGISPLSTGHPPVLQHRWVRASTGSHPRFTLPMESSPGFGSHPGNPAPRALFRRLAFAAAPALFVPPLAGGRALTWDIPHRIWAADMNSPDHSTKGTPSHRRRAGEPARRPGAPTARGCSVSGSLSSPSRGAFHRSLTVLVRYRWLVVFSLGGWSPPLPAGFLVSRGTQVRSDRARHASATGLSPPTARLPSRFA